LKAALAIEMSGWFFGEGGEICSDVTSRNERPFSGAPSTMAALRTSVACDTVCSRCQSNALTLRVKAVNRVHYSGVLHLLPTWRHVAMP
jgi:bacterioferritin-associated ferredoxin